MSAPYSRLPLLMTYWPCILALFLCLVITINDASAQDDSGAKGTVISRDVIVKQGETLRSIARREMGRAGFAPLLAEFNSLVEAAPLIPGNIVRIPIHVPARMEYAEVVYLKGVVEILRNPDGNGSGIAVNAAASATQGPTTLERNAQIYFGDTITTGEDGFVSIAFSTGSVLNLQPGTTASLQRLSCLPTDDSCLIEISTEDGKVTSDVKTRDSQPVEFKISTPYASAAVRGTIFDMDAADDLKVGVTEGAVAVSAQQETVDLDTGFGLIVEPGQAPSQPIELLPPPVFKNIPSRIAPGDTVAWWPFQNAQSYAARLSTDEAAIETLQTFQINDDRIGFNSVDAGDYYLTVRAVDENGLKGFTSNTRLTIAQIDEDITPVSTSVTRQGSDYLINIENGPDLARGYEIQVSSDDSFVDPLSVDVNEQGIAIIRLESDRLFARARVLLDPYTVSVFGETSSSGN